MRKQVQLTSINDLERMRVFSQTVSVYIEDEFMDDIIIKEILVVETQMDDEPVNDLIVISQNNDRYILSYPHIFYL